MTDDKKNFLSEEVSKSHRQNVFQSVEAELRANRERSGASAWSFLKLRWVQASALLIFVGLFSFQILNLKESEFKNDNKAVTFLASEDYDILEEDMDLLDDLELLEALDELEQEVNI